MSSVIIGQNIKAFREKLGIKQEVLAEFLEVDRVYISYWENASRPIPIEKLTKLADFFMVELSDLMEENAHQKNANVALAFRAGALNAKDIESITSFKKIVKNYLKMLEIEKKK